MRTALVGALLLDLGAVLAAPALSTRSTELAAALLAPTGAAFAVAASRALSSWIDAAVARVDRSTFIAASVVGEAGGCPAGDGRLAA